MERGDRDAACAGDDGHCRHSSAAMGGWQCAGGWPAAGPAAGRPGGICAGAASIEKCLSEKSLTMAMIVCEQVHFSYATGAGEVEVLRGVDVRIEQGTHVSIIGPSGAGKSTLLRLCAALDWPTSGNLRVGDCDSTHRLRGAALVRFRRERAGLVFQQFSLLPTLTPLKNPMLPQFPYPPPPLLCKLP